MWVAAGSLAWAGASGVTDEADRWLGCCIWIFGEAGPTRNRNIRDGASGAAERLAMYFGHARRHVLARLRSGGAIPRNLRLAAAHLQENLLVLAGVAVRGVALLAAIQGHGLQRAGEGDHQSDNAHHCPHGAQGG